MEVCVYKIPSKVDIIKLAKNLSYKSGFTLLLSAMYSHPRSRFSYLCANPFLAFRSFDSVCELWTERRGFSYLFGNPWEILKSLLELYEVQDDTGLPVPAGGAFGYFGYDLKNYLEKKIVTNAIKDVPLPDCALYFYDGFLVFDHLEDQAFIISTGLEPDGSRNKWRSIKKVQQWLDLIEKNADTSIYHELYSFGPEESVPEFEFDGHRGCFVQNAGALFNDIYSTFSKSEFIEAIKQAQKYITQGDIYQVNLSQRFEVRKLGICPYELFERMLITSPAPFSAYINYGDFQIISSSPELFLKMDDRLIVTSPIKGTRARSADTIEDQKMLSELKNSQKEQSELIMITDLLRNDLGRVCKYGTVHTTELLKIERHPTVYHMISTIEGELKSGVTHLDALSACFPGGSITGAPKIRAIQIIDQIEPVARGIYTGTHGYIGFNKRSQLSITIRTAISAKNHIWYQAGAGIVADSEPEAEYEETIAKSVGFFRALNFSKSPASYSLQVYLRL